MKRLFATITKRWWATILTVAFIVAQVVTLVRINNQNDEISRFVTRTITAECEIRAEARTTTRNILFGILDQFPQEGTVLQIHDMIQNDYPEISCDELLAESGG